MPLEPKLSAFDQIKNFLMDRGLAGATNGELANLLRGQPGQLSWGQRVRELRIEMAELGGDLICKREGKGNFRYIILMPDDVKRQRTAFETEKGQLAFL